MAPVSDLRYRELSFWMDTVDDDLTQRDPLGGSVDVDVVIVGAGFTGMWTAYYLKKADPSVRVAIVEKNVAGFGASGRNGGWCSALFPTSMSKLARMHGREAAIAMQRAMNDTVDEVGRVLTVEGINAHYAKGGTLAFARSAPQVARASAEIAEYREFGFGDDRLRWLEGDEFDAVAKPTHTVGATYTPDCAAIHPARLARGLARVLDSMDVTIYESSPALRIDPGLVTTEHGAVHAAIVVRATEGFTPSLPGYERVLIPIYSLMIATEPLDVDVWDQIGLAQRQTFTDFRHLLIYGQRTADGRMAFGGRGAPYHFGSAIDPALIANRRCSRSCGRCLANSSRRCARPRSRINGVGRWECLVTGTHRSASIAAVGWRGLAATSVTGCRPRTCPVAPWPTSSLEPRPTSPACRGSITTPLTGSRSRCGGWASTAGCA